MFSSITASTFFSISPIEALISTPSSRIVAVFFSMFSVLNGMSALGAATAATIRILEIGGLASA
jgi:hypothetical protein